MLPFEKTTLWRGCFEGKSYADEKEALEYLKNCFLKVRTRAEQLVALIRRDIPELTVHDITHLDALWETASLVAGPDYPLNPAEVFVFGAALLLHDSAMSYATYHGGPDSLKKTPEWKDAVASRLILASKQQISEEQLQNPSSDIAKAALGDVLRETHAKRAADLPTMAWPTKGGESEYLIDDSDMRGAYGDIIGKIAASHWWPPSELINLPSRINAGPSVPHAWHVHPLKVACLLRAADATHIDHRRAPRFLRALVAPQGEADVHWGFQSKMGKPSLDKNFVVYTGSPFDITEAEAWWLGFDMLASIDEELRIIHGVLDSQQIQPFLATAVKGAKSPAQVAKLITTKGWTPVNTELRVSDVPSLVELLGGDKLYGSDLSSPVRELLQNAADAIRARQLLDGKISYRITVRIKCQSEADVLEIEDNGIGMSLRVLTGPLLDFGRSLWKSGLVRQEFPGLLAKGLKTTGRFGIGFFSVFMLGEKVSVTSRRYDMGTADTQTLDFQKGLKIRPIVRGPSDQETMLQGGTRISVVLKKRVNDPDGLLPNTSKDSDSLLSSLALLVANVAPSLDVTIDVEAEGRSETAIEANDWIRGDAKTLIKRSIGDMSNWRVQNQKSIIDSLKFLEDPLSGEIHGRVAFNVGVRYGATGVVTVGGFRAAKVSELVGVLKGETSVVTRQSAMPTVPGLILRTWASEQAELIARTELPLSEKLKAASLVMLCGGDASKLPITIQNYEYLTKKELELRLEGMNEAEVFIGTEIDYSEEDDIRPSSFRDDFELSPTLFFLPKPVNSILTVSNQLWPNCVPDLYLGDSPKSCEEAFHRAVAKIWGSKIEYAATTRRVGDVDDEEIKREVRIYSRPSEE